MTTDDIARISKKMKWDVICEHVYTTGKDVPLHESTKRNFSILEKVLESWAKNTVNWRADICYEIFGIIEAAEEFEKEGIISSHEYPVRMIGIRQNGVDHPEYIKLRMEENDMDEYKDVFMLTVTVYDGPARREVKQTLYKKTA